MPDTPVDPTHPDYEWPGGSGAATKDEIAAAVAHVKAWVARLTGKAEPAAPTEAPADAT